MATMGGYSYLIFSQQNVLIPNGTLHVIAQCLELQPFVLPVTNSLLVGETSPQSLIFAHNLKKAFADYANDPANIEVIQKSLTKRFNISSPFTSISPKFTKPLHSYFFFALNILEFKARGIHLPSIKVNLWTNISDDFKDKISLTPMICLYCFVYSAPSVTSHALASDACHSLSSPSAEVQFYPPPPRHPLTLGFAISNFNTDSNAAMTAIVSLLLSLNHTPFLTNLQQIGSHLRSQYSVTVRYLRKALFSLGRWPFDHLFFLPSCIGFLLVRCQRIRHLDCHAS